MTGESCRGVLVDRAASGPLTESDRLALEAHLEACPSCHLSSEIRGDFDDLDAVDLRDGERLRALADAARRWQEGTAPTAARDRRRVRTAAFAASLVLFAGTASGAVYWWHASAASPPPSAALPAAVRSVRAAAPPSPAPTAAVTEVRPAAEGPVPILREPRRRPGDARATGGAALLLRSAGEARRGGETARAIELYREVRRRYPGSPEAAVAAIPLGRLWLDTAAPAPALAAFDAYLSESAHGPLRSEALYGRGRALGVLGARSEERRTWERLLAGDPASPYVRYARQRLAELE